MKMFGQLIIEENIFLQTVLVASEHNQMSWKFNFGCNIPPHTPTFLVTALRHSQTEGVRLLGYAKVRQEDILRSAGSNLSFKLNKVNPDGPLFQCSIGFSSKVFNGIPSSLDIPENRMNAHNIRIELLKLYEDSKKPGFSMDALQLWVTYEKVLLCCQSNENRARRMFLLGDIWFRSYQASGSVDFLIQAVCARGDAVRDDSGQLLYLIMLGHSLQTRFERLGRVQDINKAVVIQEGAVTLIPDGHPNKPSLLTGLGNSLFQRFRQLGDLDDLNQAILRQEAACALIPDGHPDKHEQLGSLSSSLLSRFEQLGDPNDLNQSVCTSEAAVALIPDEHPNKPSLLTSLGISLFQRFQQLGVLDDLNQSILRHEAAGALTPDDHPSKPEQLNNFGSLLLHRFEQFGDLGDLNHSILRSEAAVALIPGGHPNKPSLLTSLGNSLLCRFEKSGDLEDLNQSISRYEVAAALTPDGHPSKPALLTNLSSSLLSRFERLGDLDDLSHSISRSEAAVALTPDEHSDKPSRLSNLGNSLLSRFNRLGNLNDLNQSILRHEAAVADTPDGHSNKPKHLNNLGNSIQSRFRQLADPEDFQQLLLYYNSAACSATGSANIRFQAAANWAYNAHIHQHLSTLRAYATVIDLLPKMAWLGLSITDRHNQLRNVGKVVRDAASAAIALHDYQKAVEWLDQGRSVIWGQLLNLRTPVDQLWERDPGLADQLVSLSTLLETTGTRSNGPDIVKLQSTQSITQQSHTLALERDVVLQKIRELPGFERFLLSKPISELSQAAKLGPVAILNISNYGCDALILMAGLANEVLHVPLSDFTINNAQALAQSLASIVGTTGRGDRLHGFLEGYMPPDDIFSNILSELWVKIVHPVLNALAITTPVSHNQGRIWWCPTGPLAFLPIHAAGLYGEDQALGSKLSDFLISSYTPSLTALIQGFRTQSESQENLQLLGVTQPSAKDQPHIPGTHEEIECIQLHAKDKVPVVWLDRDMATIEKVQEGMRHSRWVHFACHGVQSASPTESALLLAGSSRLTLSDIIKLSLPNADLAFLSACETATGSQKLQDESVHLTAGMLLAGYRGVIGTMWSIMDNDAPQVANDVYSNLLGVTPPDPTRAAEALHLAVQKLREQLGGNKSFLRWVPFIHFGV
ncbi:CHAT domain-containing protein [Mycena rebaudengoi]|nr:CHAT domain-containing protein [Mycena rebaudengoi]